MNGWQKAWVIVSGLWAIICVLLGLISGSVIGGVIVGAAIPAMLYVIGLGIAWIREAL